MHEEKRKLLNLLLSDLFNAASEDDFLHIETIDDGVGGYDTLFKGKEPLPPAQVKAAASEAKALLKVPLLEQILESMKYVANAKMYNSSKNDEDMVFGKAMLWCLDVIENKIKNISKLNPKK